jgi:Arc/MetJ-type ribon-helix-helix transcriptional regulator
METNNMSGHKKTPNAAPIINITIDEPLLERVENYRFSKRFNNRSEAIRDLLNKALDIIEKEDQR